MKRTSLRTAAGLTSTVALVIGGVAATTSVAHAAPGDSAACPAVYPAAGLTLGQEATGLTTAGSYKRAGVEHNSSVRPEEFTGTYRGTIEDEAQGDLYVFQLEGSRITKADGTVDAGVWAGISGSPLYAADGSLIGSVSYSFGSEGASTFAGVTPAQDLYDVLPGGGAPTAPAAARRNITLSSGEKASLRSEGVPAAVTNDGLSRLDPVTSVGGFRGNGRAAAIFAAKGGQKAPRALVGSGTSSEVVPIVPGGNVAASDSYGTISSYSVGTATAVCGDDVVAFGHPNMWAPSSETIHGAKTVFIQESGASSFKMTNLGAPSGTLTADRLNGIVGKIGAVPKTTVVSSRATGGKPITGLTHVSNPDALPYIVASQAYRDATLSLDQDAGGKAAVAWTINYVNQAGQAKTFTRSQRYSSRSDLGYEVTSDVAGDVSTILDNPFEKVRITRVNITDTVNTSFSALKIGKVSYRTAGSPWRNASDGRRITVKPGKRLLVKVGLVKASKYSAAAAKTVNLSYPMSKKALQIGELTINGNSSSFDEDEEFDDILASLFGSSDDESPFSQPVVKPRNLTQLLAQLKATPAQDDLTSSLNYLHRTVGIKTSSRKVRVPAVVSGDFTLNLRFRK